MTQKFTEYQEFKNFNREFKRFKRKVETDEVSKFNKTSTGIPEKNEKDARRVREKGC